MTNFLSIEVKDNWANEEVSVSIIEILRFQEFSEYSTNKVKILLIYQSGCSFCHQVQEHLKSIQLKENELIIFKMNLDSDIKVHQELSLTGVPALLFEFNKGKKILKTGAMDLMGLMKVVDRIKLQLREHSSD